MKGFEGFAKIYALTDDQDLPFYIGCTIQELEKRREMHVYEAMKSLTYNNQFKIGKIRSLKYKIGIRILESIPVKGKNGKAAQLKGTANEKKWIKKLLSEGYELCNRVHGNIVCKRGDKTKTA